MKKPMDHTSITCYHVGDKGTVKQTETFIVAYKLYKSYDHLPSAAKSPQTLKEYNTFWKYYEKQKSKKNK